MTGYLPVSSNDSLRHLSLLGSPETLCGHPAVDAPTPSNFLDCDTCLTLSGGNAILKQNNQIEAGRECLHCEGGLDATGHPCWNCGGSGQLEDENPYDDSYGAADINVDDLHGTKVAAFEADKIATNWTRDGQPIEDGFTVMISTDQAARTPFLDLTRVSVSEKRTCPDCNEDHWLSKISSCIDCDGLKCNGCMETIGLDSFMGTCKKCAGGDSDLSYETNFEESLPDQDRFLSFLMQEEDQETDPLFLPDTFNE
jgi:hypothetical protein